MLILVSLLPASSGMGFELIWQRGCCHAAWGCVQAGKGLLGAVTVGVCIPRAAPDSSKAALCSRWKGVAVWVCLEFNSSKCAGAVRSDAGMWNPSSPANGRIHSQMAGPCAAHMSQKMLPWGRRFQPPAGYRDGSCHQLFQKVLLARNAFSRT